MLALATASHAASYITTNAPGWNLIVNQLDGANGNNIRNVIIRPPTGSVLAHFNPATKAFETEVFQNVGGTLQWMPGTAVLNPGDGLMFSNAAAANVLVTFSGNPHVPVLPVNLGTGLNVLGRQTNATATVADILGITPPNFTVVYRFIPGAGHDPNVFSPSNYTVYSMKGGAWVSPPGAPPSFNVGESVVITTNGSAPVVRRSPSSQTVCPRSPFSLTTSISGTVPMSFQWLRNGTAIANANASTYSVAAASSVDSGTYTLVASNVFGTATTAPATVTVADTAPPSIVCPSNIVMACRGLGGTLVTFDVTVTDNCDSSPVVVSDPPSGSVFPPGITIVKSQATDASGNSSSCTFTVTVVDDVAPSITCPSDKVVAASSAQGTRVFYEATVVDDCDTAPVLKAEPPSGSIFPIGNTVVQCIATDSTGNKSVCRFNVTVLDQSCCRSKQWGFVDIAGPAGRFSHVMAYDSARARVVLFGGMGTSGVLGDTWEWDGAAWAQFPAEGPTPRYGAAMAYDTRIGRVVMHGGRSAAGSLLDDTWLWDGKSWTRATVTSIGGRFNHSMAYDLARNVTVLYGGADLKGVEYDDTWTFDGSKWKKVASGSPGPGTLQGHAMAYGSGQRQMLLFGGQSNGAVSPETWLWDGATWKLLTKTGPAARAFAAMAYSDNCDSIILFGGGKDGIMGFDDTWEWDGSAWSQSAGKLISPRGMAAMAHDSARGRTVLFGGTKTGKEWYGETFRFGPAQTLPHVASVSAVCGEFVAMVGFDKPMAAWSAMDTNHYALICGNLVLRPVQAVLTGDPRIVQLYFANPITSLCGILINGVQDECGNGSPTYRSESFCYQDPCGRNSAGTEFWLTFPGNYATDPLNQPQPQVLIVGPSGTVGSVTVDGVIPAFSMPFAIPAGGTVQITLPRDADLGDVIDTVRGNAVHVVASQPINVYGMNHIPYSSDAFLATSTRGLGKTYLVMSYGNLFTGVPELNGTQFAIAATVDNTKAMVVPSTTVGTHTAGVPYVITLMKGQTYQLRSTNDAPADLTGTIIAADQPIAVMGGHRCANIPTTNVFFANHLVEQMPPTDMWGTSFVTVPFATRQRGDTIRVMALTDGTTVKVNGVPMGGVLSQGKYLEIFASVPAQITTDQPALVAQYSNSSDYDQILNSDPFMVVIPPVQFYSASYKLPAPPADFTSNYLNLVVPVVSTNGVMLDGVALSPALFTILGTSGYATARVPVSSAAHQVSTASGLAFGLVAYGYALYDGYGYAAASCGNVLMKTPSFRCPPESLVLEAGAGCVAIVPDLRTQVGNPSEALVITQEPAPGTALGPGTYPIRVSIIDAAGRVQVCTTGLSVIYGRTAGLECPQDITVPCASADGQYVFFEVKVCNPAFSVVAVPPSGSLFPPGTTKVNVVATNANGGSETCTFNVTVDCLHALKISQVEKGLVIDWSGPGLLQNASNILGPWTTISNAVPPFLIQFAEPVQFFRLIK